MFEKFATKITHTRARTHTYTHTHTHTHTCLLYEEAFIICKESKVGKPVSLDITSKPKQGHNLLRLFEKKEIKEQ